MFVIIYSKLKASGMAIFPFIIVQNPESLLNKQLINHEKIHLRQELELLIIPFYIIYGLNYIINYFKYKSSDTAYRNIVFEREAYANDENLDYLKTRKWYSFIKYF